jgi:ethanolamine utilization protein EutQ (cupin superfamily)
MKDNSANIRESKLPLDEDDQLLMRELSKKVIEERKGKQYHGQPGAANPTTKNGLRVGKKKKQRLRVVKYEG